MSLGSTWRNDMHASALSVATILFIFYSRVVRTLVLECSLSPKTSKFSIRRSAVSRLIDKPTTRTVDSGYTERRVRPCKCLCLMRLRLFLGKEMAVKVNGKKLIACGNVPANQKWLIFWFNLPYGTSFDTLPWVVEEHALNGFEWIFSRHKETKAILIFFFVYRKRGEKSKIISFGPLFM